LPGPAKSRRLKTRKECEGGERADRWSCTSLEPTAHDPGADRPDGGHPDHARRRRLGRISALRGGAHDVVDRSRVRSTRCSRPVGDWIAAHERGFVEGRERAAASRSTPPAGSSGRSRRDPGDQGPQELLDLPSSRRRRDPGAGRGKARPATSSSVQIGKGESDGVGVDMPVVTGAARRARPRGLARPCHRASWSRIPVGCRCADREEAAPRRSKGQRRQRNPARRHSSSQCRRDQSEVVYTSASRTVPSRPPSRSHLSKVTRPMVISNRSPRQAVVDFSHLDYVQGAAASAGTMNATRKGRGDVAARPAARPVDPRGRRAPDHALSAGREGNAARRARRVRRATPEGSADGVVHPERRDLPRTELDRALEALHGATDQVDVSPWRARRRARRRRRRSGDG